MSQAESDQLALFNARIETVKTKPAFRDAWKSRRALLPVQGWIEWRPALDGGRKQPHLIHRTDGKPVVLAALYTPHEGNLTFAVLTGPSSPSLAWLHDRQPVALHSSVWDAWLADTPAPTLTTLPARVYEILPLDPAINNGRTDHPGVVQVTGAAIPGAA